jgi:hypothetical protein
MEKLETYCSSAFLESIYRRIDRPLAEMLLADKDTLWIAELYKFIHGNCTLITDISQEELIRRSTDTSSTDYNPNFKKLWKNGRIAFVSYPETFVQMMSDEDYFNGKTNEVYFINESKKFCEVIEDKHGLVCACPDNMDERLPGFFVFEIRSLSRGGNIKNWDFLKQFRYPANSAIIADNYILPKKELIDNNILKILQNIMPPLLDEAFDLTIFTRHVKDLEYGYNYLREHLTKMFPYNINLSIGLVDVGSLGIHDRDILTNYCWYNSGAGFTLFDQTDRGVKILNNTKVFIYPVTHVGNYIKSQDVKDEDGTPVQAGYFAALEIFKKIWHELPEKKGIYKTFIGERRNRLLD